MLHVYGSPNPNDTALNAAGTVTQVGPAWLQQHSSTMPGLLPTGPSLTGHPLPFHNPKAGQHAVPLPQD